MNAYPSWTPASRPGIIPLHPLSFGRILGASFSALRQNPRVLLGFALCVQAGAYLLLIVVMGAVTWASFSRLDGLRPDTDDYRAVEAGSVAITIVTGVVLALLVGVLSVIVQGIVVSEVAHAAVAEKLTLRALWRKVKPVAWRLIGYSLLLMLVVLLAVAIVVGLLIGIGVASPPAAIGLTILVILGSIPLYLWLSTKLLLVPAAIILERQRMGQAIARSWTLVRGRFWPALGIIVVISVAFSVIGQVVNIPFTILTMGLGTVIAPTGDPEVGSIVTLIVAGLLSYALALLVQTVALIVQATATSIIYIDCRMRREGLDLDLLAYMERRDAGAQGLPDPYLENIGRALTRPPAFAPGPYQPYGAGAYPYGAPVPAAAPSYGAPTAGYAAPTPYPGAPAHYPASAGAPYPTAPTAAYPAPYPAAPASYPAAPTPAAPAPYGSYPPPPAGAAPAPMPSAPAPGSAAVPAPDSPAAPQAAQAPQPAAPAPTHWAAPGQAPESEAPESPWR